MRKPVKYLAIVIAAVLALLLVGAGIVAATFNPNDYKPMLIRLVKEKQQRTLTIPGDIKLSFFPKIGADLGRVGISERHNDAGFASIEHAKVSLALIPLLSKRLVVDRVKIDGLRASITRFKDGSTNFDDLLGKPEGSGNSGSAGPNAETGGAAPLAFDIDSVDISNARILFDDRAQGRHVELANLDLDTGRIADGVRSTLKLRVAIKADKPELNATLAVNSGFMMESAERHYVLNGFDATLKGSAAGITGLVAGIAGDADLKPADKRFMLEGVTLDASGQRAGQPVALKFTLPKLAISDTLVSGGPLNGTANFTQGTRSISAKLDVPTFEGSPQALRLPALALDAALKDGALDVNAKIAGALTADIDQHTLSSTLKGSLDGSAFDAKLGMSSFSPTAYTFDIGIDKLDLDRYRTKPAGVTQATATPTAQAEDKPIDLSALQDLRANGKLRIGALKVAGMRASNARFGVHAADGKLDIDPLTASLYGGSVSGALSASAAKPAHFTVRQTLSGIDIGPLLTDAIGKAPIEGKGNVNLDVATSGATLARIKRDLNGSARLELRDGAVHGVNIAQAIRSAKARIGQLRGAEAPQGGTATADEKTDFSQLSASFRIVNGVAHNDDLSGKSPLIRIGGAGDIDLGAERVDYLARVTVVSSLEGQGGPELQALKGLTVPVKLAGPFSAIGWHVDFGGIASGLAKQKLGAKKEELKSKAEEAMGKEKDRLQQQLQERLKGLFGQ